jgi:hypothetical protein
VFLPGIGTGRPTKTKILFKFLVVTWYYFLLYGVFILLGLALNLFN